MNPQVKHRNLCEIVETLKRDDTKLLEIYCKIEKFTGRQFQPKSQHCLQSQERLRLLCEIIDFLEFNESKLKEIRRQVGKTRIVNRNALTPDEHLRILAQPKVN